jgi:hypothetical protein
LIWLTIYHLGAWFGGTKPSQAYQAKRLIAACLLASLRDSRRKRRWRRHK